MSDVVCNDCGHVNWSRNIKCVGCGGYDLRKSTTREEGHLRKNKKRNQRLANRGIPTTLKV